MFHTLIDNEYRDCLEEKEKEKSVVPRELGEILEKGVEIVLKK